jgi:lycopene beta-cyclase
MIIFYWTGLSALMTAYKMVQSGKFQHKNILLLDENSKKTNDRTWCFWTKEHQFGSHYFKKWDTALFANENFKRDLHLQPYTYNRVLGLDFTIMFLNCYRKKATSFLNEK